MRIENYYIKDININHIALKGQNVRYSYNIILITSASKIKMNMLPGPTCDNSKSDMKGSRYRSALRLTGEHKGSQICGNEGMAKCCILTLQ